MPRIPEPDLQRLKEEVSVQRLVEASGVALKKGGKDFTGRCPFHADDTASLVITPHKNLWHCLLHQHQREVKTILHRGKELAYIEVAKTDIALANAIAHEVLGRTLDELPPQTRNLLVLLRAWAGTQCTSQNLTQKDWRFTRKALRAHCHWGDTQLKVHLARLVEFEHVVMHRRGLAVEYELVFDGGVDTGAHMNGLLDVDRLATRASLDETHPASPTDPIHGYDASRSGLQGLRSASGRPVGGVGSPCGRDGVQTPPSRASIGDAGMPLRNGHEMPETHGSGASSLAAGPVIAMAH